MYIQETVLPAILTYAIVLLVLIVAFLWQRIDFKKVIVVSTSFIFIGSGFLVQILVHNYKYLEEFLDNWYKAFAFPLVTILATTFGIFLGNSLLKVAATQKDRREIAILLIIGLRAHITSLGTIYSNVYGKPQQTLDDSRLAKIQKLLTKAAEDKSYGKALIEIGRLRDSETDMLLKYESYFQRSVEGIEQILVRTKPDWFQFDIVATLIYAAMCSYVLTHKYFPNQVEENKQFLLEEFRVATRWLVDTCHQVPTSVRARFIGILKDARMRCQELSNNRKTEDSCTLYVLYCLVPLGESQWEAMFFGNSIEELHGRAREFLCRPKAPDTEQLIHDVKSEVLSPLS